MADAAKDVLLDLEEAAKVDPSGAQQQIAEDEAALGELYDRPGQAFVEGALGSILPTPQSEFSKGVAEENPWSSGAGQLAGFMVGAGTGMGLPGMGAKLGQKAAGKILSKAGQGTLSRAAASITGGAIADASVGLHEATIATAEEGKLGIPGAANIIAHQVGSGAAWGGGLTVTGLAFGGIINKLFKVRFSKLLDATERAKGRRIKAGMLHDATKQELEDRMSTLESLVFDVKQHRANANAMGVETPVDEFVGAVSTPTIRGGGKNGEILQAQRLDGSEPRLTKSYRAMERADERIRNLTTMSLKKFAKEGQSAINTATQAAVTAGTTAMTPQGRAARTLLGSAFRLMDSVIMHGTENVKPLRKLATRSLKAGRVTMDNTIRQGDGFITTTSREVAALRRFRNAVRAPVVAKVTDDEYREMMDELEALDPASMEASIRMGVASQGVPQEYADPLVEKLTAVHNHLLEHMPTPARGGWMDSEPQAINEETKMRFLRRMRQALGSPLTILTDLEDGKVTPEAADTFWQLDPQLAQIVATTLENKLKLASEYGARFGPEFKRQAGLIINRGKNLGRTYDPKLVQLLQGQHQEEQASRAPAQPKGTSQPLNIDGLSEALMTGAQGTAQRLGM